MLFAINVINIFLFILGHWLWSMSRWKYASLLHSKHQRIWLLQCSI